jgi:hypothetical protein
MLPMAAARSSFSSCKTILCTSSGTRVAGSGDDEVLHETKKTG